MKLQCLLSGKNSRLAGWLLVLWAWCGQAAAQAPLRRPISPSQPMWLVHVDTRNYADPQKIIDLIPADVRPYVVLNLSLSISNDGVSRFNIAEYGGSIANSWLTVCAQNKMWAMVQCSSGGYSHFSNTDTAVYRQFYRRYPNFLGFNYAEPFWGFDDATNPLSQSWTGRMDNLANLLALSNQYGGYLTVSWCGNQYSNLYNPVAMLKRVPAMASAAQQYAANFILCEKYTTVSYQFDKESTSLGAYLSGYSGNYGIRYDRTGWTDSTGSNTTQSATYVPATGLAPNLEHIMLTGQTVVDGPELIFVDQTREGSATAVSNGYSARTWTNAPQWYNVSLDLFRKVLDGTVRIPTRQEVIARTKVAIINDVTTGNNDDKYSSPATLFDGLYLMPGDGQYQTNKSFFKSTGRYPAIPTVYQLSAAAASAFSIKINKSAYATRWPTVAAKRAELDALFPAESRGDIYAGRHENGWVVYNPYKTRQIAPGRLVATGRIGLKYNTCDSLGFELSQYSASVVKETTSQVQLYLNNYDNLLRTGLKTNVIRVYGSTAQPTYTFSERGTHQASVLSATWVAGVYTLTVQHNGPLDITLNCAGTAPGRLTTYTAATITPPAQPATYAGPWQYEAEVLDYKSLGSLVTNGFSGTVRDYQGQGYVNFGTNAAAALRKDNLVLPAGTYTLQTRYLLSGSSSVATIALYVNGTLVATPTFTPTGSPATWATDTRTIVLGSGANSIEWRATAAGASPVYFDNIRLATGTALATKSAATLGENRTIAAVPNPATGSLRVELGSAWKPGDQLALYSSTGRLLYSRTVSGPTEALDAAALSTGLYLLRISNQQGQTSTCKLLKQ
ncbi:MAG: T9SS type A sorting domain-containing protein [Cytophagaceae bacterium]|nr:MAG: T9SS type A sorting domain-containing protein [Cytophagaceae bacterium]